MVKETKVIGFFSSLKYIIAISTSPPASNEPKLILRKSPYSLDFNRIFAKKGEQTIRNGKNPNPITMYVIKVVLTTRFFFARISEL